MLWDINVERVGSVVIVTLTERSSETTFSGKFDEESARALLDRLGRALG